MLNDVCLPIVTYIYLTWTLVNGYLIGNLATSPYSYKTVHINKLKKKNSTIYDENYNDPLLTKCYDGEKLQTSKMLYL